MQATGVVVAHREHLRHIPIQQYWCVGDVILGLNSSSRVVVCSIVMCFWIRVFATWGAIEGVRGGGYDVTGRALNKTTTTRCLTALLVVVVIVMFLRLLPVAHIGLEREFSRSRSRKVMWYRFAANYCCCCCIGVQHQYAIACVVWRMIQYRTLVRVWSCHLSCHSTA